MEIQLQDSERRWLRAVLILGTFVLALVLLGQLAAILAYFSDILLVLLLAWLFAFMISPLVTLILRAAPRLPRVAVVGAIYIALALAAIWATLTVAGSLATSISRLVTFITSDPAGVQLRLRELLAPLQDLLNSLGIRIDLVPSTQQILEGLAGLGGELAKPLADLALFSLGLLANLLIVVFLSLFIVLDKDRIVSYLNRLVPPQYAEEARLFESAVASSFGGFIRGQAIQGLVLAGVAIVTHLIFGLDFMPASAAAAGFLQAIPFFGPALAWAPPVIVALLVKPDVMLPTLAVMLVGWFVVNNILLPRLMASAVGIHPVVVLVSVLVGIKIAGAAGAIFALPFAAVIASFFQHFLNRSAAPRDVASRAARRIEQREGRSVRVPKPPPATPEPDAAPAAARRARRPVADKPLP
jgi:predicted PurR-regulated permease PerM